MLYIFIDVYLVNMMTQDPYLFFVCQYCSELTVNDSMICDDCKELKEYYSCRWISDIIFWFKWMLS